MSMLAVVATVILMNPLSVRASETVTVEGLYRHPLEGSIEDSGGESSEALGQSMVTKMVGESATFDGANKCLDVTFYMMNSISNVDIQVQFTGTDMFASVDFYQLEKGNDEATYRVPITVESDILRVEAFVEPMGRAVVFYVVIEGALDGVDFDVLPSGNTMSSTSSTGLVIGGPDVGGSNDEEQITRSGFGIDSNIIIYAFLFLCSVLITSGVVLILFTVVLIQVLSDRKALKQLATERKEQVFEKVATTPEEEVINTEQIIELLKESGNHEEEKN